MVGLVWFRVWPGRIGSGPVGPVVFSTILVFFGGGVGLGSPGPVSDSSARVVAFLRRRKLSLSIYRILLLFFKFAEHMQSTTVARTPYSVLR